MADGVVTTSGREFALILESHDDAVRAIALAARSLILDILPQTIEVVWIAQRSAGYGTGVKKMSEQFCWILPQTKHVTLAFAFGVELDDPAGLLQGTGARIRNVRLGSVGDVARPAVRDLITFATTHRMPPAPAQITVLD